jgi:uncharacterized protein YndB with AHSA1/START domain
MVRRWGVLQGLLPVALTMTQHAPCCNPPCLLAAATIAGSRLGYHSLTPSLPERSMKHHAELLIEAPRELVWEVFDNPDNMSKWQPTLTAFVHKSGSAGQPGAISELTYEENGRTIVMTETITERRDQEFLAGTYETQFGTTTVVNRFESTSDGNTRWSVWCRFQFRGFMKVMALFIAGSIRRRTNDDLGRFKLLAESVAAER